MIAYKKLLETDLVKIAEIDRSEVIRVGYEVRKGALAKKAVNWDTPNFIPVGAGEHSVAGEIKFCNNHLERNAIAIGGFDGKTLVAIGILTPNIRPAIAQLAYLHVSRAYRRQGIGTAITHQLLEHAIAMGLRKVYVSAVPSESAVGFYMSLGFDVTEEPIPELYILEPEDVHMVLELDAQRENSSA